MDFIPVLAIVLVLTTVIACLVTGQRLGEARQNAFQLEMQAEQMRRQVPIWLMIRNWHSARSVPSPACAQTNGSFWLTCLMSSRR
jgi:hypothetical protein